MYRPVKTPIINENGLTLKRKLKTVYRKVMCVYVYCLCIAFPGIQPRRKIPVTSGKEWSPAVDKIFVEQSEPPEENKEADKQTSKAKESN